MTLQTGIYFIIILSAVFLSGFLTWKARQQRDVPGAGYYCLLALAMCFASAGEILSMIAATEPLALFWFKARFFSFAAIPPLWLLFVLDYSGRRAWVSRGLKIGLSIIPLITCVLILTANRHGLWVKQDVGFFRQGPFLLADLSRRVPGIGYLIHTFYVQGVMLTGSFLLLKTSIDKARDERLPAFLLAASALVPALVSVVLVFNLLPAGAFNPTIPGLATGAALAAAAIFRFDFLKKAPVSNENALNLAELREKRSQALFFLIFGMAAIAIMAAGYISYINFKKEFQKQLEDQLSAVADLTVSRLTDWRSERLGDAEVLRTNPAFSFLMHNYLENPADNQNSNMLQSWLGSLQNAYRYERVFFIDTLGDERLAFLNASKPVESHLIEDAEKVLSSGKVVFLDFHCHTNENTIRLAFLVPVYADGNINNPLGILVLEIDPALSLYPILRQWPVSSETAEILLVRRDQEDVLFLNPLRFHSDAALNLRIPLTETKILAVKAVRGQTGPLEGQDYRGNSVVGHARAVPDSPWFLVVRMDQDEANAPLKQRLWRTFLFISALMAFPGTGLILVLRQQRMRFYEERIKAAEERSSYAQRLEETVMERTFELEAANRELEAFSYSVSHDLRAPLRHINGYISLLTRHFPETLPEKGRHYLKNIVDSATEMGELIDSLLKFSRAGRQEMHKLLINMNDLFKEAQTIVQQDHPKRVIQWKTAGLPVVLGDAALLKLVWINLLDNAIKFTKNKDCAKIEIGFTQNQKEGFFFVRDNGAGFDMHYAQKLFGVFQRLHSAKDYKGTGIGLANVHRIILRHGGQVWAESEPDKGAVFYFTLPQ